ncbi:MAG: hypothetical protein JAY74_04265 [Candidatus Thiodiazotropha taylori]|nr:hypothetical protein [Candidatus Thiodiazotropha taylori]
MKTASHLVSRILFGCLLFLGINTYAASETTLATLEAEHMPIKTTGGSYGSGWNIWSDGYIAELVEFPHDGIYNFEVIAFGSPAQGVWPNMLFGIDYTIQPAIAVDSPAPKTYRFQAQALAGEHYVSISFNNDFYNPPEDRNLYVDKVRISTYDDPTTTVSLTASPDVIAQGFDSTLTWSSTGSASCIGTGFETNGATSGSEVVSPFVTTTYVVTCDGVSDTVKVTVTPPDTGENLSLPLYDTSNIEYLGRFNLPSAWDTIDGGYHEGFRYIRQGGGALAYNPSNNSLFIAGGDINNDGGSTVVAEVSIPTPRMSAPFNTAGIIQDFALLAGSIGRQYEALGGEPSNGATVTGLMISNDRLLFTVAGLYTNSAQPATMFVRPSLDLDDNVVLGPYKVTDLANQRIVGNGMGTEIPANWQSEFAGYKAIVGGGGNLSTMNSASYGPGFHFFNPDDVQGSTDTTVPGVNACYYTDIAASSYPFVGEESDVWNGMSTHRGTIMLPETRTVFAYGAGGSDAFYDTGGAITGRNQGTYATGGTMNDRFYLYDARDLKDVFDGNESALNNIRPYATFDMDFSLVNTGIEWIGELDEVRGLTFDPVSRKAYILETGVGIHVLKFHVNGD